jgi:hypothetical protein
MTKSEVNTSTGTYGLSKEAREQRAYIEIGAKCRKGLRKSSKCKYE